MKNHITTVGAVARPLAVKWPLYGIFALLYGASHAYHDTTRRQMFLSARPLSELAGTCLGRLADFSLWQVIGWLA